MVFNEKYTVLQACHEIYLDLPIFCYHEALSIAGNCRMCLVEVSNNRKLQVACATTLSENLKVNTNTTRFKKLENLFWNFY